MKKVFITWQLLAIIAIIFTLTGCKQEVNDPLGFSVAKNKQVRFTPGNLRFTQNEYAAGYWSCAFSPNQYDLIGMSNTKNDELADKIDLVGWSSNSGVAEWGISTSTDEDDYSGDFRDWGNYFYGENLRTLTAEEWRYLIEERDNASSLITQARIMLPGNDNYANGLILLPDNWQNPEGALLRIGMPYRTDEEEIDAYATYQTLTLSEWQRLEYSGAVFLPAAGAREGTNIYQVQSGGRYHTADSGKILYFDFARVEVMSWDRSVGRTVRLVKDL